MWEKEESRPGRVEVVLPWHAILYSGGMPIFVIGKRSEEGYDDALATAALALSCSTRLPSTRLKHPHPLSISLPR